DRSRGWRRTVAMTTFALAMLALARGWSFGKWDFGLNPEAFQEWIRRSPLVSAEVATISSSFVGWSFYILLPVIGSAYYAELRRAQREQSLWDAALAGHVGSDEFLTTMRGMIDSRIEDVGFHLRYAEMLFACGDHGGAAVE